MKQTPPLVLVEWEDSRRPNAEWAFLSDYSMPGTCDCISVGYLIRQVKWMIALAPNLADVNSYDDVQTSGIIHIPARSIKRMVKLVEEKRETKP